MKTTTLDSGRAPGQEGRGKDGGPRDGLPTAAEFRRDLAPAKSAPRPGAGGLWAEFADDDNHVSVLQTGGSVESVAACHAPPPGTASFGSPDKATTGHATGRDYRAFLCSSLSRSRTSHIRERVFIHCPSFPTVQSSSVQSSPVQSFSRHRP